MHNTSAIELINSICYKPGWSFSAEDHTNRFQESLLVHVEYEARDSKQEDAPDFPNAFVARAKFVLMVGDLDLYGLYRALLDEVILPIEEHEAREFLRIPPTFGAPFHPHTTDGMKRWGNFQHDLTFGLA